MSKKIDEIIVWFKNKKERAEEISKILDLPESEQRVFSAIIQLYLKNSSRPYVSASQIIEITKYVDTHSVYTPLKNLVIEKYVHKIGKNTYVLNWDYLEMKLTNKKFLLEKQILTIDMTNNLLNYINPKETKEQRWESYEDDDKFIEYIKYLLNVCAPKMGYVFVMTKQFSSLDEFGDLKRMIQADAEIGVKFKILLHKGESDLPQVRDRITSLQKNKNLEIRLCGDTDFLRTDTYRFLLVTASDELTNNDLNFDGITIDGKINPFAPRNGIFFTNRRGLILGPFFDQAWKNGEIA